MAPPPPRLPRYERGRRLRAYVLDFVETTVPRIRNCIKDRAGERGEDAREARARLGRVADQMTGYVLDFPAAEDGDRSAKALVDACQEFRRAYENLGIRIDPNSLAGALAIELQAVVGKIEDFLRDR